MNHSSPTLSLLSNPSGDQLASLLVRLLVTDQALNVENQFSSLVSSQMRSEIHKSHASDPNLNHISRSPTPGFRPRALTFSFTNRYRSRRRRMSVGARSGEKSSASITHSSQLAFLDFVDLFKSFGLRCRKDLKELFEQIAVPRQSVGPHEISKTPPYSPKDKDMGECLKLVGSWI